MTPQEIQEYVSSIRSDLASVTWSETTPSTSKLFEGVEARTFTGTGLVWTHNLVVWQDRGRARSDGSAVMLSKPLVVRYTPDISEAVLKTLQDRGFCG